MKPRKTYSPQFKAKVALEALEGIKTINELAQEHGVHPVQIGNWKKALHSQACQVFESKRGPLPVSEHEKPEPMLKKIGQLQMEVDWLKKKLGVSL